MGLARNLWQVEWRAVLSLAVCALAFGGFMYYQLWNAPEPMPHPFSLPGITAAYTLALGFVPVVAFGAPIYATLIRQSRHPAIWAVLVGVFPGILLLWLEPNLAPAAIACGAVTALLTHLWVRRINVP
jgi:hypothetical protein